LYFLAEPVNWRSESIAERERERERIVECTNRVGELSDLFLSVSSSEVVAFFLQGFSMVTAVESP
jgi:hypothetical protein